MKLFGLFSIEVLNTKTGEKKQVIENQKNLVLNNLFSVNGASFRPQYIYCSFGTNSVAPSVNDTVITNPQNISSARYISNATFNRRLEGRKYIHETTIKFSGDKGDLDGNFSEIGMIWGSSNSNLFTRALLKDQQGNPATLTFGEFDIVTVYYTFGWSIEIPENDAPFATATIDVGGQTTNVSFHWGDYENPKNTGLFQTGVSGSTSGMLTPTYYLNKLKPLSGVVADFNIVNSSNLTSLYSDSATNTSGHEFTEDGVKFSSKSRVITWAEGLATGTWDCIAFVGGNNEYPGSDAVANLIAILDPPLVKGESDVFTLTDFTITVSRGS